MSDDQAIRVSVDYNGGNIVVPDESTIYPNVPGKPSEVEWEIVGCPAALSVKIMWEAKGAPLAEVTEVERGRKITGTKNKGTSGTYRYAVLFVDDAGKVVDGVDPKLINYPPD